MQHDDETEVAEETPSNGLAAGEEITEEHGDPEVEAAAASTDVITDINDLDMMVEPAEAPDLDELEERMTYAPSIPPGLHVYRFSLDPETPMQNVAKGGRQWLQVNFRGTLIKEDGSDGKTINYVRADNMRTGKMTSSRLDELFMALSEDRDLATEWLASDRKAKVALSLLQKAEEAGRLFKGKTIWRHYDKSTGETLSTSPQKPYKSKKTGLTVAEKPWPRDAKGQLERHPGNEEITGWLPVKLGSK